MNTLSIKPKPAQDNDAYETQMSLKPVAASEVYQEENIYEELPRKVQQPIQPDGQQVNVITVKIQYLCILLYNFGFRS